MIKRFLKSVRQKPKSYRDNIAFIASGVITAVIFAGWLYNTPTRLAAIEERHKQPEEREASPSFSRLFGGISDQVANIKEAISVEESVEVVPEEPVESQIILPSANSTTSGSFASSSKYSWSVPQNTSEEEETEEQDEKPPVVGREVLITTTKSSSSSNEEPSATSQ